MKFLERVNKADIQYYELGCLGVTMRTIDSMNNAEGFTRFSIHENGRSRDRLLSPDE